MSGARKKEPNAEKELKADAQAGKTHGTLRTGWSCSIPTMSSSSSCSNCGVARKSSRSTAKAMGASSLPVYRMVSTSTCQYVYNVFSRASGIRAFAAALRLAALAATSTCLTSTWIQSCMMYGHLRPQTVTHHTHLRRSRRRCVQILE